MIIYDFIKESMKYQVKEIQIKELMNYEYGICKNNQKWGRKKCIIMTDIASERTAHLLNYIFNSLRYKANIWFQGYGGGFLIDGGIEVIIGNMNEIGFNFSIKEKEEVTNSIVFTGKLFKEIRAGINKFIKFNFCEKRITSIKNIIDNGYKIGSVTLEELELLKDFFNWKTLNKKYSQKLIDKMIGEKLQDQFIISTIDVVTNEIKKLLKKEKDEQEKLGSHFREKIHEVQITWRNEEKEVNERYEKQINLLQAELTKLTKIDNVSLNNGFTF